MSLDVFLAFLAGPAIFAITQAALWFMRGNR